METTLEVPESLTLISFADYVESFGVSERTLKRRLAAGEVPGARKDERGRWMIPVDTAKAKAIARPAPIAPPLGQKIDYDLLPTLLTLDQAAFLLHPATARGIGAQVERFDIIELPIEGSDGHKRKMVPLATIKRMRGLIG